MSTDRYNRYVFNIVFAHEKDRKFKSTLSSYVHNGGSIDFRSHHKHCYVFFHFGENAKKFEAETIRMKFNSLPDDMEFVKYVENKFKVNINVINLEPIVNSILEFNNKNPNLKIHDVLSRMMLEIEYSLRTSLVYDFNPY